MSDFWDYLEKLIDIYPVVIDRPKNTSHPRYPHLVYPLDYGYLDGTAAVDRGGVDVWIGSQSEQQIEAVLCTVDLFKRDVEVKILMGCSEEEIQTIVDFHNDNSMRALLIKRKG